MIIALTHVKMNSRKSKIKTNRRKVLQRHKCLNTYIPTSPQNHSCPLFDELLHCIYFHSPIAINNTWTKHVYSTMKNENFCKYFITPTSNFV